MKYRIAKHINPLTGFIQWCIEKRERNLLTGQDMYCIVEYANSRQDAINRLRRKEV